MNLAAGRKSVLRKLRCGRLFYLTLLCPVRGEEVTFGLTSPIKCYKTARDPVFLEHQPTCKCRVRRRSEEGHVQEGPVGKVCNGIRRLRGRLAHLDNTTV